MSMEKIYRFDYYDNGYKRKYITAKSLDEAIEKADVNRIIDYCIVSHIGA